MNPLYKMVVYKKNIFNISNISIFFLFLLMLWSMDPWFSWIYRGIMIFALSGCFLLLRCVLFERSNGNYTICYSIMAIIFIACLVYFMTDMRHMRGLVSFFSTIRAVLVFAFVMAMHKEEKKQIVTMTTYLYAWIMGISMAAYFLVIAGVNLPYSMITHPGRPYFFPNYYNYGLFVVGTHATVFFQRFQSVFAEPGNLGPISAFLVYINQYEIRKKRVLVIFISVIVSFSLAGYVLLAMGYIIWIVTKSKNIYKPLLKILIATVLLASTGFIFYAVNPDSMVSRLVLSRFERDADGNIQHNRTGDAFDRFFEMQFITSTESILWGANLTEDEDRLIRVGNSSYRVFLVRQGIIAMILLFLMYFAIISLTPSLLGVGLLLLCAAAFIQRTALPLWEMQLFLFVGATQYFYIEPSCKLGRPFFKISWLKGV